MRLLAALRTFKFLSRLFKFGRSVPTSFRTSSSERLVTDRDADRDGEFPAGDEENGPGTVALS